MILKMGSVLLKTQTKIHKMFLRLDKMLEMRGPWAQKKMGYELLILTMLLKVRKKILKLDEKLEKMDRKVQKKLSKVLRKIVVDSPTRIRMMGMVLLTTVHGKILKRGEML